MAKYQEGDLIRLAAGVGGFPLQWTTKVLDVDEDDLIFTYRVESGAGTLVWVNEDGLAKGVFDFYMESNVWLNVKLHDGERVVHSMVVSCDTYDSLVARNYTGEALYGALCYICEVIPERWNSCMRLLVSERKQVKPEISAMLWAYSKQGAEQFQTIKFIRSCFPLGLKEAKDLWDAVKAERS